MSTSQTASTTHILLDGVWVERDIVSAHPDRLNFVIVCDYGDWSGFRTLADCLKQIPETWASRPRGFYRIEER